MLLLAQFVDKVMMLVLQQMMTAVSSKVSFVGSHPNHLIGGFYSLSSSITSESDVHDLKKRPVCNPVNPTNETHVILSEQSVIRLVSHQS